MDGAKCAGRGDSMVTVCWVYDHQMVCRLFGLGRDRGLIRAAACRVGRGPVAFETGCSQAIRSKDHEPWTRVVRCCWGSTDWSVPSPFNAPGGDLRPADSTCCTTSPRRPVWRSATREGFTG